MIIAGNADERRRRSGSGLKFASLRQCATVAPIVGQPGADFSKFGPTAIAC